LDVDGVRVVRNGAEGVRTTFSAEPGEIVVLVGPTGSGKTTLLRALLGLEPDVKGSVRYAGQELSHRAVGPSERPFAWVPQEPAIVTGTLEENVALGIHRDDNAGQAEADWGAAARGALEQIGAGVLSERKRGACIQAGGHELSGGERQWVAIARALASQLPVLLLDEPTSGLDEASQQRVLQALTALRGTRTIVLVTHRPEPLAIADRVVAIGTAAPSGTKPVC
jgi:ABC-type transport system involved in cytochrome bd biosynthesis fused ATPase/permease subunit